MLRIRSRSFWFGCWETKAIPTLDPPIAILKPPPQRESPRLCMLSDKPPNQPAFPMMASKQILLVKSGGEASLLEWRSAFAHAGLGAIAAAGGRGRPGI